MLYHERIPLTAALVIFGLSACKATEPSLSRTDASDALAPVPSALRSSPPPASASITPEIISIRGESYQVYAFDVPLKQYRIAAVDLALSKDLRTALDRKGSVLAINAGYFDKSFNPEGLVVSEGKSISDFKPSLGGGVLSITGQVAQLHDSARYNPLPQLDFALQSKPRLVVEHKTNIRTDDNKLAARTAICTKKGGSSLEIFVTHDPSGAADSGPSLATMADLLVARNCEQALNLDGGPSTGAFWREKNETQGFAPSGKIRQGLVVMDGSL